MWRQAAESRHILSENKAPVCPKCGTPMVSNTMDGNVKFDGSTDLSGYKCPNCTSKDSDK